MGNHLVDLTGRRYGTLTVIKRADQDFVRPDGNKCPMWICQCDCSKIVTRMGDNLKSGSHVTCGKCTTDKFNLIGKHIEHFDVISVFLSKPVRGKTMYHCRCDCGTEFDTQGTLIKCGAVKSCGHLRTPDDLGGKRFGKLIALYPVKDNGLKKWMCRCDCGNFKPVAMQNLLNSWTQSCGCIDSQGQMQIAIFLSKNNIRFEREYTFNDCRDKRKLPFDFMIYDKKNNPLFIIEFDGRQHFEPVRFNGMTEEEAEQAFKIEKVHDNIKKQVCEKNSIPLLRIKYTDKEIIEKIIINYIKSGGWNLL